tara:strand:+ start:3920 stop:4069 length:150 start_codon:yes stop_codon:yes gene_type:complete
MFSLAFFKFFFTQGGVVRCAISNPIKIINIKNIPDITKNIRLDLFIIKN